MEFPTDVNEGTIENIRSQVKTLTDRHGSLGPNIVALFEDSQRRMDDSKFSETEAGDDLSKESKLLAEATILAQDVDDAQTNLDRKKDNMENKEADIDDKIDEVCERKKNAPFIPCTSFCLKRVCFLLFLFF